MWCDDARRGGVVVGAIFDRRMRLTNRWCAEREKRYCEQQVAQGRHECRCADGAALAGSWCSAGGGGGIIRENKTPRSEPKRIAPAAQRALGGRRRRERRRAVAAGDAFQLLLRASDAQKKK